MEKANKIIYVIYINDIQFTCLFEEIENEINIPIILGFKGLTFIKKEESNNQVNIYYELKDFDLVKINLNGKLILEKLLPKRISLSRLRHLLLPTINSNFTFSFNKNIIQIKDESSFSLENIIQDHTLNLFNKEFNFLNETINEEQKNIPNIEKKESSLLNSNDIKYIGDEIKEPKQTEILDKTGDKDLNEPKDENQKFSINDEIEYELYNDNSCFCKIKISPNLPLSDLREKIENLIPRRTLFLMKDRIIEPSTENNLQVKAIAEQNMIKFKFPIEDKSETKELEIYVNCKFYIKKEFYLHIKLKFLRINLKFDDKYKFIYKGNILPLNDENKMTLDELCYKELKVFFIRTKDNNSDNNPKLLLKNFNGNFNLNKESYKNIFSLNEIFDNWIIIGKEKSGKTTFINCLLNYLKGVKFEDEFRYSIEGQKKNNYEIYDLQENTKKFRIVEFPGFTGELEVDKTLNKDIKKFIRELKEVKIICFVINGNETRLTESMKNIFSNIWDIFAIDILMNFIFILTNCDAKQPPIIDCIKNSLLSKFLNNSNNNIFFKFNNSYLYDINGKDFWDLWISHYDELLKEISKKDNISLNLTKNLIEFNFDKTAKKFLDSLLSLINYRYYYNILKNIDSYDNKSNMDIPYNYHEIETICANEGCKKKIYHIPCKFCRCENYREIKISKNKIALQNLKGNKKLCFNCLNYYTNHIKEQYINASTLYKLLKEFYNSKLVQINTLIDDLNEMIDKKDKNKHILLKEINQQEIQYNNFINGNVLIEYKNYVLANFKI